MSELADWICTRCGKCHKKKAYGPGYGKYCPDCGSPEQELTDEAIARVAAKTYKSQAARDAQASLVRSRGGTCEESYCDYLDESAQQHYDYFMARGDKESAEEMLSRSWMESLQGNDGD